MRRRPDPRDRGPAPPRPHRTVIMLVLMLLALLLVALMLFGPRLAG